MEAKRIRYPIGVQTFRDIVEGGYLYIDKTGIVHDLAETYKYVFLSRPRRFGKSLLSSTFHSYFAGEKDLFEGLEAGRLRKEWTRTRCSTLTCQRRNILMEGNCNVYWVTNYPNTRRSGVRIPESRKMTSTRDLSVLSKRLSKIPARRRS